MRRVLFAITALTVAVFASAGEPHWVRVSTAVDQDFVNFIDTTSVAVRQGRLTARYLWDFAASQTDLTTHKPYQSETGVGVYDCLKRQSGAVEITMYEQRDARGGVVDAVQHMKARDAHMTDVEPGSIGEEEVEFVCDLWGNRAAQWTPEGWHRIDLASDSPSTSVFFSAATLRAQPDGSVRALFMSDYGSDAHGPSHWRSRQDEVLIDCRNQRLAKTHTRAYFSEHLGAGRAVRFQDPDDPRPHWERASPESLGAREVQVVCAVWSEMHAGIVPELPDGPTQGGAERGGQ